MKYLRLFPLLLVSSCYTVPDTPDFVLNIDRDYMAVADCAWLTYRTMEGWTRDNLDSMQQVSFTFGNDTSKAGRIDISSVGSNKTRVSSHVMAAVWGKDFHAKRNRPIFEACAS